MLVCGWRRGRRMSIHYLISLWLQDRSRNKIRMGGGRRGVSSCRPPWPWRSTEDADALNITMVMQTATYIVHKDT